MAGQTVRELELLQELLPRLTQRPDVLTGPGDDCAVLDCGAPRCLLAAVDSVIADVHFYWRDTPPEAVGAKLLKRNLSDIAAMGGEACWGLTALNQAGCSADWVRRFFDGLEHEARRWNVALVGGDYAGLPQPGVAASLTILGMVERGMAALRSQARGGDVLFVTGVLGDSLRSGHHLTFEPRLAEGRWLVTHGFTRAMMDLSDGLAMDAKRMAVASGVELRLDCAALPCRTTPTAALTDGEDYELLFAVAAEQADALAAAWPFATRLTPIGRVVAGVPGTVSDADSGEGIEGRGYEHMA